MARTAAEVNAAIESDDTPFSRRNNRNFCEWCPARWLEPPWWQEPKPPVFGHPPNDCDVWLSLV